MFGVRCSVFDVRCSVFGVRCSVFGVRCSVFGVRCSVFGVRRSAFDVQLVVGVPAFARGASLGCLGIGSVGGAELEMELGLRGCGVARL